MVDRWIVEPENSIESNRRRRVAVDGPLFNRRIRCAGTRQRPLLMAFQAKDMDLPKVVAVGQVD